MESNNQQIEDLKKKIEKYRQALESLKTSKVGGNSQTEKRMGDLEEQFLKLELKYSKISELIEDIYSLMDETREVVEEEGSTEESKQLEKMEERQYQQSKSRTIPSFKVLKQLANDIPVVYTNSHSLYQDELSFSRPRNKKLQFKAMPLTDSLQTSNTIVQNFVEQSDKALDNSSSEIEILCENSNLISSEPINETEIEPHNVGNRVTGFWKGILKK